MGSALGAEKNSTVSGVGDGLTPAERIKLKGLELGFSHVGIIPCHDFDEYARGVEENDSYWWFVETPGTFYEGCFPSKYFPQGKSIVCATIGFGDIDFPEELLEHVGRAYLARCYVPKPEILAGRRVAAMADFLRDMGMDVYDGRVEIPARPAAFEAGIIDYGDNNFARTKEDGSFIIIYTWIVDQELDYDEPTERDECPPNCHLCMDACPTGAIEAPRKLNVGKCILWNDLSIPMGEGMEDKVGVKIHGCDICQTVCPRNHAVLKNAKRRDPFLDALVPEFDLTKILMLESFDDQYYKTVVYPIMYNYITDVEVFRRNAAVALGNSGNPDYIPALEAAIEKFPNTPTAEAAARAIEKLSRG